MIRRFTLGLMAATMLATAAPAAFAASAAEEKAFALALPEEQLARAALEAHPAVLKARSGLDLAKAQGRQAAAGPHELTITGQALDRRVNNDASYGEFALELSRAVRSPGKARLDREAGLMGEKAAADSIDDARHQTGLVLADAWLDWIEAAGQAALARDAEASLAREAEAMRRRVALKDAAVIELEQAQAALAAAASRRAQAEGAHEAARLALAGGFPELPLPSAPPSLPEPVVLERPLADWRALILERSHEIRIADYLSRQADAVAARARLDRRPDPTIGVRAISERGGREQGLGLFFSTPLGGARRSAVADAETARASAARVDLMRVRREVEAVAQSDAAAVQSGLGAWRGALEAVAANEAAAQRTRRGRDLGELDLAAVLLAERQAFDARRAELTARAQAWRALAHLRLDAHDLWADED